MVSVEEDLFLFPVIDDKESYVLVTSSPTIRCRLSDSL